MLYCHFILYKNNLADFYVKMATQRYKKLKMVGYESHDRAAPGGAAAPKFAAPDIYFSLLEVQRGIIPNFFRYINCK